MDYNRGLGISGILHATVDIHFRVFTDEHGLFVYMCVKFHYLTMDYPLPLRKSIIGHVSLYAYAYAICYRMAGLWQSWTSTVIQWFFWWVSMAEVAYKRTPTHTHTHTHTHIYIYTHTHTHTHAVLWCTYSVTHFWPTDIHTLILWHTHIHHTRSH